MLSIKNLQKNINGKEIFDNISLYIERSKVVAIQGKSGCGKSTLLKIIAKLDKANSGTLEVTGKTAMVLQDYQLFPNMTVYENITYIPRKILNISHDKLSQAVEKVLKDLDIAPIRNQYPKSLSGGQKQRVAIARVLMSEADIIIMDEPTSSLDHNSASKVGNIISLLKKMGKTIIFSSHDTNFNRQYADVIFDLESQREHCVQ